ncbi:MAG: polyribonucleotide nucleotidyltransferase, partial [Anaerolineae bacterium]|nr:polyribonucleotide nucleotidyltransferase [Thermoflexales bacterium]MDW8408515.1 polyribonucleotide nucleotidyltransferase [Anaerolineae bacterium]
HAVIKDMTAEAVRSRILRDGVRPDGRTPKQIRPVWCDVGDHLSPRAHGIALFTRGDTQVLSVVTLGSKEDAQKLDGLFPAEEKRYMHNYNMPPYSTGEAKVLRGSSRREVGHGALAERALLAVIPDEEAFPYTIRVVSEVLSSNGSTSMASVCGSTLALMDAGVPIKAPVAGIAMGLITGENGQYTVLTDIQGIEDHIGDMDFKVAGTRQGITALQMDIKIAGLSAQILEEALEQAREARLAILDRMMETIAEPRPSIKPHAPRMLVVQVEPDKIGTVIGPSGKTVRSIQDQTGAKIDIQEDGRVFISSSDGMAAERAKEMVEALTMPVKVGNIYTGKVVRITDFGAFVEIAPKTDGMVHVSQLADHPVRAVSDEVSLGQEVTVMVTAVDPDGKIRLSRRAVLEGMTVEEAIDADRRGGSRGGPRSAPERSGPRPGGRHDAGERGGPRREHGERGAGHGPRRPGNR